MSNYFWPPSGGGGTVTSVGLSAPSSILSVSGSPVISAGTLALSLVTQTANTVWAGPTTGSAANPTFRALVAADIPSLSGTYLTVNNPVWTGTMGTPLTASQAVVTNGSSNLTTLAYASANTASALVQRDGSGNFSAGTMTGSKLNIGTFSATTGFTTNYAAQFQGLAGNSGSTVNVTTDGVGRALSIFTQDYVSGSTGSRLAMDFAAGTGNTSGGLQVVNDGSNSFGTLFLNSVGGAVQVGPTTSLSVNVPSLTASQIVVTDASKNLTTIGYTASTTYSPVYSATGSSGIAYTHQYGQYTRIGNLVHFAIDITLTTSSSFGTGQVTITLPVSGAAINPQQAFSTAVFNYTGATGGQVPVALWASGSPGSIEIFFLTTAAGGITAFNGTSVQATTEFVISGYYFV